jgi:hypothetical protein
MAPAAIPGLVHSLLAAGHLDRAGALTRGQPNILTRPESIFHSIDLTRAHIEVALAEKDYQTALVLTEASLSNIAARKYGGYFVEALTTRAQALAGDGQFKEAEMTLRRAVEAARARNAIWSEWLTLKAACAMFRSSSDSTADEFCKEARKVLNQLLLTTPDALEERFRDYALSQL